MSRRATPLVLSTGDEYDPLEWSDGRPVTKLSRQQQQLLASSTDTDVLDDDYKRSPVRPAAAADPLEDDVDFSSIPPPPAVTAGVLSRYAAFKAHVRSSFDAYVAEAAAEAERQREQQLQEDEEDLPPGTVAATDPTTFPAACGKEEGTALSAFVHSIVDDAPGLADYSSELPYLLIERALLTTRSTGTPLKANPATAAGAAAALPPCDPLPLCLDLLTVFIDDATITSAHVARGIARLQDSIAQLILDAPHAPTLLHNIITFCAKDGVINPSVALWLDARTTFAVDMLRVSDAAPGIFSPLSSASAATDSAVGKAAGDVAGSFMVHGCDIHNVKQRITSSVNQALKAGTCAAAATMLTRAADEAVDAYAAAYSLQQQQLQQLQQLQQQQQQVPFRSTTATFAAAVSVFADWVGSEIIKRLILARLDSNSPMTRAFARRLLAEVGGAADDVFAPHRHGCACSAAAAAAAAAVETANGNGNAIDPDSTAPLFSCACAPRPCTCKAVLPVCSAQVERAFTVLLNRLDDLRLDVPAAATALSAALADAVRDEVVAPAFLVRPGAFAPGDDAGKVLEQAKLAVVSGEEDDLEV